MADAWGGAWGQAWGISWGGHVAVLDITDTDILQKPVNCVLAGEQKIKDGWREWSVPEARRSETARTMRSRAGRISGQAPSFTTKTGKRGYD